MGVKVLIANIYGELFGAKYLSKNLTYVSSFVSYNGPARLVVSLFTA